MDFLGIKNQEEEEEKEMAELIRSTGCNSEEIQAGTKYRAEMNVTDNTSAADANYNNNSSKCNVINMKNDVRPDTNLGLLSSYFSEKRSPTSELKLGMAFEKDNGFHSSVESVGGARRSVAEFIPPLDLSAVGSRFNSIDLFHDQSGLGSPIAVMEELENKTSSDQGGCSGNAALTIPGKQSGAQMTIFYGGTVNVCDDIPADKVQAIMLIASGGNYSNYSHTALKIPFPAMKLSGSGIHHHQPATRNVHTDLPIARKHSLQRFLENRKDRLNAKATSPYKTVERENRKPQHHHHHQYHCILSLLQYKSPSVMNIFSNRICDPPAVYKSPLPATS